MIWAEARSADHKEGGAIGPKGVIGRQGKMPWYLPEDLAFFREKTLGCPVIMGRRTWESLAERFRPLPGRKNIVVTRDAEYVAPGATVAGSVKGAIELASSLGQDRVWVMGGGQLYESSMAYADELVVTKIDKEYPDADTFAPKINENDWILKESSEQRVSKDGTGYRFERWLRRG